jgi:hypothetical protein
MKTVPMKKTIQQGIGILSASLLFMYAPVIALAADRSSPTTIEVSYSVQAGKTQNSKKHRVRLMGSGQDKVLCTVNGIPGKSYQIFVFTIDSKLVSHTTMRSGETAALNNLSKGNYLFEVLMDDDRIQSGQLTIK